MKNDRGGINLGCIFMAAVVSLVAWHGYVFGLPHYYRWVFEEKLFEVAENIFHEDQDEAFKEIMDVAAEFHINLAPENISLKQTSSDLSLIIRYQVPVATPLIKHTYNFTVNAERRFSR